MASAMPLRGKGDVVDVVGDEAVAARERLARLARSIEEHEAVRGWPQPWSADAGPAPAD